MKLIITRHGESQGNVDNIYQGDHNTVLTKKGISQAKALANRFTGLKIDVIYSSGLLRAYDTAIEISKVIGCDVEILRDLNEKSYGIFAGLKKSDVKVKKVKGENSWDDKPIGGESLNDVMLRVERALKYILEQKRDTIVVCHEGIIRMFRILLLDLDLDIGYSKVKSPVGNTSVFEYEIKDEVVDVIIENCQMHVLSEMKTSYGDV